MQRQPAAAASARPGVSAAKFKERLEQLKAGVRFVYTCDSKDIASLKLENAQRKYLQRNLDRPGERGVPVKIVEKIREVEFLIDLENNQRLPRLLTRAWNHWDVSPKSLELIEGPSLMEHRNDVILYQKLEVLRTKNTAPFGLAFYSNLHQHFKDLTLALAQKTRNNACEYPVFNADVDPSAPAFHLKPNTPDWQEVKSTADQQLTRFLPIMDAELSSATFYSSQAENLQRGMTPVRLPHPINGRPTDYMAMSYCHIVFQQVKKNWEQWKVQVSPLDGERTNLSHDYMVLLEKSLVDEVIEWCQKELPPQTSVVDSQKIMFAMGRYYQKPRADVNTPEGFYWDWRSTKNCNPPDANLHQIFKCSVEIKLTYALLPRVLQKDAALLIPRILRSRSDSGLKDSVGFENRKLLNDALEQEANIAVAAEQMPLDFTKLTAVSDSEDEDEADGAQASTTGTETAAPKEPLPSAPVRWWRKPAPPAEPPVDPSEPDSMQEDP